MLEIYQNKNTPIKNFTIYGERHSGTNFLEQAIKNKFDLDVVWDFGWKHFFGLSHPTKIQQAESTLFFCIVRNPYDWIMAMYNAPHHVHPHNSYNPITFLTSEWYSIDSHGVEILEDRNYTTNLVRYKNIFELRQFKCLYLVETMPRIANNCIVLSYENLVLSNQRILDTIGYRFNLTNTNKPPLPRELKKYYVEDRLKDTIDSNIDWPVESMMGYSKIGKS
ncbi:MAG: hypothetical protein EBZ62_00860 [Sphingobacteriia bacterium]|nr:hypothetical protein [Sphingobacteriia bacterium]